MRALLLVAALGVGAGSTVSIAHADQGKADALFDDGRRLANEGKFKEACDKFEAAIELEPSAAGTMLRLGQCNEKLGKLGTALGWYKKAQAHGHDHEQSEIVAAAEDRINVIESHVPVVKLEFAEPLPPDARVSVDGGPISREDITRFVVDAGPHTIEIVAPHKKKVVETIDSKDGSEQIVQVKAWVETSMQTVDKGKQRRHLAYGLAAGSLAMFAIDVGAGLYYRGLYTKSGVCPNDGDPGGCPDRGHANTLADHANIVTTTTFVAGTLLGVAAIYLYISAPKRETFEAVIPVVSPEQVGFAYSGRF